MFNFGADDDKAAKALCLSCRAMLEKVTVQSIN